MKYIFTLLTLSLLLLAACTENTNGIANSIINEGNLTTQIFSINTKQDTSLITKDGLKIKIAAGSIEASADIVTLEIKEAISLEDMLKAGLTTQSDKGILSSDGMFYIATKETSVIKKPIEVSVPTEFADNSMKLYKGAQEDGNITWKEPGAITQLDTSITALGESLFKNSCASCHAVEKQLTGPALAWMDKRHGGEWLYSYTQNSAEVIARGDVYACCVYNKYNKTAMNAFPSLSGEDIAAIYRYINKESKRLNIPANYNPNSDCDSCDYYAHYYGEYYQELLAKRDSLIKNNGEMTNVKVIQPADANLARDSSGVPTKVVPDQKNAEYYQFFITAYGWYNIDVLIEEKYGAVSSQLAVRIIGEYEIQASVFLIIPTQKVFAEGGKLSNGKEYGFYSKDGSIPLTQGLDAFIIAMTENNGKMFFQQKHFVTSASQTIEMQLEERDKASILASFEMLRFDSVSVKVEKTKNFEGIKAMDEELQTVLNKLNECSCQASDTSDIYK